MDRKPIILITAEDINDASGNVYVMSKAYGQAVREAGGEPFGAASFRTIAEYVDFADALIITHGQNMHPFRHGGLVAGPDDLMGFSQTRDDFDFAILDAFVKAGKPVLGVNRGMLVINAYLGGQIQRQLPPGFISDGEIVKPGKNEKGSMVVTKPIAMLNHKYGKFDVTIDPESRLAKYMGEKATIISSHAHACKTLAEGLKKTAWAPDGIIMAFESENGKLFGIQWNPEQPSSRNEADYGVYRMFIDAVKEGK